MEKSAGIVSSVEELLDQLGGVLGAAEVLREPISSLNTWKHRKKIAASKFLKHGAVLRDRGIEAAPELWQQEPPPSGVACAAPAPEQAA